MNRIVAEKDRDKGVWQKCQAQAQALPPKDGRYALGVVLFWLIILLLILKGIDLL